ncbi:histidine kinase [Ilyobacter sp.]
MKKNMDYEKFCEYISYVEKNRYEVLKSNVDWDSLYEGEDSYEDIVSNF